MDVNRVLSEKKPYIKQFGKYYFQMEPNIGLDLNLKSKSKFRSTSKSEILSVCQSDDLRHNLTNGIQVQN